MAIPSASGQTVISTRFPTGIDTNPQESSDEHIKVARFIVNNRIAVYEALVRGWIGTLAQSYPLAPLVRAMQLEFQTHLAREKERRKGYWF